MRQPAAATTSQVHDASERFVFGTSRFSVFRRVMKKPSESCGDEASRGQSPALSVGIDERTYTEEEEGRDKGEEAPDGGEEAHDKVGAQAEQEGDERESGRDGRENEGLGVDVPDRITGGVGTGELRQALGIAAEMGGRESRVSDDCARTKGGGGDALSKGGGGADAAVAEAPDASGETLAVQGSVDEADRVPDRCRDRDDDEEAHRREVKERADPVENVETHRGGCGWRRSRVGVVVSAVRCCVSSRRRGRRRASELPEAGGREGGGAKCGCWARPRRSFRFHARTTVSSRVQPTSHPQKSALTSAVVLKEVGAQEAG